MLFVPPFARPDLNRFFQKTLGFPRRNHTRSARRGGFFEDIFEMVESLGHCSNPFRVRSLLNAYPHTPPHGRERFASGMIRAFNGLPSCFAFLSPPTSVGFARFALAKPPSPAHALDGFTHKQFSKFFVREHNFSM